jgi:hypothetical protein
MRGHHIRHRSGIAVIAVLALLGAHVLLFRLLSLTQLTVTFSAGLIGLAVAKSILLWRTRR